MKIQAYCILVQVNTNETVAFLFVVQQIQITSTRGNHIRHFVPNASFDL